LNVLLYLLNLLNATAQEKDPNSILNYFRNLIKLRKNDLTLVYGKYVLVDKLNPNVYAYQRVGEESTYLVLLNFKPKNAIVDLKSVNTSKAIYIMGNYPDKSEEVGSLRHYESVIYKLK
jgi:oligo-1,6-glucosidase